MHNYIQENPSNVVVVHCLAGHGRTGVVICAYLLFEGMAQTPDAAMEIFANARSSTSKGVGYPSQKRYIFYAFEHFLRCREGGLDKFAWHDTGEVDILDIQVRQIYKEVKQAYFVLMVFDDQFDVVFNSAWFRPPEKKSSDFLSWELNLKLRNDFTVKLFKAKKKVVGWKIKELFRVSVNAKFVPDLGIAFAKSELDGPHSLKCDDFGPNISAVFNFRKPQQAR
jgi:protein-tyrosine phosphatase